MLAHTDVFQMVDDEYEFDEIEEDELDFLDPTEAFPFLRCQCPHCRSIYLLHVDFDLFACVQCMTEVEVHKCLLIKDFEVN